MEDLRSLRIRHSPTVPCCKCGVRGGEEGRRALADHLRRRLYFTNEKRGVLEGASGGEDMAGHSGPSGALLSEPFPCLLWEGHDLFTVVEAQDFSVNQESWPLAMDTGRVTEHSAKEPWWLEGESWRHSSLQQPAVMPQLPPLGAWDEVLWWRTAVQMYSFHMGLLVPRAMFTLA